MSKEFQEALDNFFLAAEYGRADVINALADHSRDRLSLADIVDPVTGRSPLHVAVARGKKDALRALLAVGFPPDHQSKTLDEKEQGNRSAYALAQELKAQDLLLVFHQFLIQQVAANDVQSVNHLLAAGVDVNITDAATRGSLLHWASSCQAVEVLHDLLEREDVQRLKLVDARNGEGATPLHLACYANHVECVQLLLAHNADVSLRGNKGFSEGKTARELATKPEVEELFSQRLENLDSITKEGDFQVKKGVQRERRDGGTFCQLTADTGDSETCVHKFQNENLSLQLEEKDLLVNQLKSTIEALVQELQESAMLGEERVMLDYVRKLRDEKMIVERKLDDANDFIRDQKLQLDSLKEQIRQMSAGDKQQLETDHDVFSHTSEDSTSSTAAGLPDSTKSNLSASEIQQLEKQIEKEGTSPAQSLVLDAWTPKSQREQVAFNRYTEKHGPYVWSTIWNGIWAGTNEVAQDDDEEVVITV
ncbi:hypothetical protein PsorP6_009172 [Peronosclerospora sorghi]|uniref:Uncharacterized protein n=1 Tax=Peronosclerospora sorghi TaxID=230839 RepID=A0ACC0W0T5_9STRA|nr:hypothetical protein PsorP6_009172 [Peronosclerospora sorghi]